MKFADKMTCILGRYPSVFKKVDHAEWFQINMVVFEAFCHEMNRVIASGYQHFSGYTIWEDIRQRTAVAEQNSVYKIDQNRCSDVIRLYVLAFPKMFSYFRYKNSPRFPFFIQAVKERAAAEGLHFVTVEGLAEWLEERRKP